MCSLLLIFEFISSRLQLCVGESKTTSTSEKIIAKNFIYYHNIVSCCLFIVARRLISEYIEKYCSKKGRRDMFDALLRKSC